MEQRRGGYPAAAGDAGQGGGVPAAADSGAWEEIVHLAHHAAVLPDLWNDVAGALRRALHAQAVGFFEHDYVARQGDIPHADGIEPGFHALYRSRVAARNAWLDALRRCPVPGETFTGAELLPNWEFVRTEFYRDWLRPQKFFHGLIGITFRCADEIRCVVALRPLDGQAFDRAGRQTLASLLPHLQCACRLAAEVAASRRQTEVLLDTLGALPEAVTIVDGEAHPIVINRKAELLLAAHDGLAVMNGVIAAGSLQETVCLRRLIAAAAAGAEAAPFRPAQDEIVIGRPSGEPPLLVRIAPIPHPIVDPSGRKRAVAALITRPVEICGAAQLLCRFYHMTPAEARLAALIVSGRSLNGAAAELRITRNTARTHMKRIYAKTDTHRQADLVRILASGAAASR